ncbi:hypothetical protein GCM10010317_052250 [Streptomyces mirabilis]|nr:hypothetical protein GCM10010317_052250 [Streptomyces mirabilis]
MDPRPINININALIDPVDPHGAVALGAASDRPPRSPPTPDRHTPADPHPSGLPPSGLPPSGLRPSDQRQQ